MCRARLFVPQNFADRMAGIDRRVVFFGGMNGWEDVRTMAQQYDILMTIRSVIKHTLVQVMNTSE